MDLSTASNKTGLLFSRPGTPGDDACNEAFNRVVRREFSMHSYFLNLAEAAAVPHS
jgi:transposase InsO family protein